MTIFEDSNLKILKKGIFGPKFGHFFSPKILHLDKFEVADFEYDNIISNFSPKIPKSSIFGPKFKGFYFCNKLWNKTNSRTLISNMTTVFSKSSPKICKSSIFGPKFSHFCFVIKFCD